ncbi:hypothetical protein J4727_19970 [Providencia rettgeri]|uniref:Uncharacterized protein n=1 Tax=Providencia rettgeri TaxID=587 RepID=A0A939NCS9_PRORE|nr:hypothetical protein [Providencia rettgeri]
MVLSVKVVVRLIVTRGKERLQCGGKLSAINQEGESMSEQLNCQSRMDAATTLYLPQTTIPVLLNQ